jgi:hypothetical protein
MHDAHDIAALAHYEDLIDRRYPPHLAAALAAARYAYGLTAASAPLPLPALRDALGAAQDAYPELARDVGRLRARVDDALGVPITRARRTG